MSKIGFRQVETIDEAAFVEVARLRDRSTEYDEQMGLLVCLMSLVRLVLPLAPQRGAWFVARTRSLQPEATP